MQILIDSRDTYFTIDNYGTFTLDSDVEYEIESYIECLTNDGANALDLDESDFDVNYDMTGYRQALAAASIDYIKELTTDGGIVTDIKYERSKSPEFYNYTTDSYTAQWTYNVNKLRAYIIANYSAWCEYTRAEWATVSLNVNYSTRKWINNSHYANGEMVADKHTSIFTNDDCIASMLDFYTRELYKAQPNGTCGGDINSESYLFYMYENVQGYEFIEVTKVKEVL